MVTGYIVYVDDPAGWDEDGPYSFREVFFGQDMVGYPFIPAQNAPLDIGTVGGLLVETADEAQRLLTKLSSEEWFLQNADGEYDVCRPATYAIARVMVP